MIFGPLAAMFVITTVFLAGYVTHKFGLRIKLVRKGNK